jgi:SWI/SNF-related matrix-associated actin-dependent regulator of chromatin subfamily A3
VTESSRELVICDQVARLFITIPNATSTPQNSNKLDIVQQYIMSNLGKRASSWVDLTGSDDENSAPQLKQARVSASQSASVSSQPRPSQSFRDAWVEADEEDEILDLSQDADEGNGWVCVGAIDGKIVGIRYYDGYATMGEQVMVRREPGNPYDSNAIRINNVQGTQIGHLPRNLAAKLAPFMVGHVLAFVLLNYI